jgi:hypothetical protein
MTHPSAAPPEEHERVAFVRECIRCGHAIAVTSHDLLTGRWLRVPCPSCGRRRAPPLELERRHPRQLDSGGAWPRHPAGTYQRDGKPSDGPHA